MAVNVYGAISIAVFYVIILVVGLVAARKGKKAQAEGSTSSEAHLLAGRSIGLIVGTFTMTATWVGGGYINGTAEAVFTSGLVWAQAPFGYAISLILGGLLFAKRMRQAGYVTMLDPLQDKYGRVMGGFLFIPALLGETFWSAAILKALGATLAVILDLDIRISVIVSACIAVFYTFFGGLFAVAYTDVLQLFCIFFGLWVCIPFAMVDPAVTKISVTASSWYGTLETKFAAVWVDYALLLIFGGIPWQVYFQRVLSAKSPHRARALSFIAAFGCIVMSIPAILIGAIAKSTSWNETAYGQDITESALTLPLVLQYLTPTAVSFLGLGAISAAVMSSADSSCLSAATLFANNIVKIIYSAVTRKEFPQNALVWVVRIGIIIVGALAMAMAITIDSIYGLWFLCSDLVYVILFPQLLAAVHIPFTNTYGSVMAYVIGLIIRLGGGEPIIGMKPFIYFPYWNAKDGQLFPFRTLAMLCSLASVLIFSLIPKLLFEKGILPRKFDLFRCIVFAPEEAKVELSPTYPTSEYPRYYTKGEANPAFTTTEEAFHSPDAKGPPGQGAFQRTSKAQTNDYDKDYGYPVYYEREPESQMTSYL